MLNSVYGYMAFGQPVFCNVLQKWHLFIVELGANIREG